MRFQRGVEVIKQIGQSVYPAKCIFLQYDFTAYISIMQYLAGNRVNARFFKYRLSHEMFVISLPASNNLANEVLTNYF